MTLEKLKKEWRRFNRRGALFLLLLGAFCVFSGLYAFDLWRAGREARAFEKLAAQVEAAAPAAPSAPAKREPEQEPEPEPEPTPEELLAARLAAYGELREENPDFCGWISIEGTELNYPVMHTPSEPERYLRRSFDGKYSVSGTPFLDGACYEGCGNYIVYGHMMKNGTMFAALKDYTSEDFWREHPVIRFDTPERAAEYEVLAAFYSRAYYQDETGVFRYYRYTDLTDPSAFEEYLAGVRAAALYDTGVDAQYGDELLTLSTCSYHTDNGRFVVVARRADNAGTAPREDAA